jgi:hypothetical protein
MIDPAHASDFPVRMAGAISLGIFGLLFIIRPDFGAYPPFDEEQAYLSWDQRVRLRTVLANRYEAERDRFKWRRLVGILAVIAALLGLVPGLPYSLPWAALFVAMAACELIRSDGMRRAVRRRAAAMIPRSPFQTFTPLLIYALAVIFLGVVVVSLIPSIRLTALLIAAATLVLTGVAWQIAVGPAFLTGDDLEMEYAVDQRLRTSRVTELVLLACSPATLLVVSSVPLARPSYELVDQIGYWTVYSAYFVALFGLSRVRKSSIAKFGSLL